jgi:long-chain acyl-CoA synthetase
VCIDPGTCRGDAPEFQPTLLAAVPMIFDKIRSNVLLKVQQTGGLAARAFGYALESKTRALERGMGAALWDLLVFDKLRARLLGGKVRYMLSGGGPLSRATQVFMNVVFNCPVGQGFGLTETVGACCTVWPNDRSYGRVGAPIACSQIRLEDWAEGGYFKDPAQDPERASPNPRGEILVGGPNVTMGYFKLPDETSKAYFVDADGLRWFRTGDIGEVRSPATPDVPQRHAANRGPQKGPGQAQRGRVRQLRQAGAPGARL